MKKRLLVFILSVACVFGCFSATACNLFETSSENGKTETEQDIPNGGNSDGNGGSGNTDGNGDGSQNGGDGPQNNGGAPHVHSYGDWKITAKPKDSVNGVAARQCTSCSDIKTETLPKLTDSAYTKSKDTATCSKGGKVNYSITVNGSSFAFDVATPATGNHKYVGGECTSCSAKDPNYTSPHVCEFKATYDGTGHFSECLCGQKKDFVPHNYTYHSDNGQHWKECSVFGESTNKVAHTYVNGVCECGVTKNVKELEYKLNADGSSYSVIGIGTITDTNIVIPNTYNGKPVTNIDKYAFRSNNNIVSVEIADGIELAKYSSGGIFEFCTKLESVKLPSDLEVIQRRTFYGCEALKNIEIPETVIHIGAYAFAHTAITSVNVSKNAYVEAFAFFQCRFLQSVNIEDAANSAPMLTPKVDFLGLSEDYFQGRQIDVQAIPHYAGWEEDADHRLALLLSCSPEAYSDLVSGVRILLIDHNTGAGQESKVETYQAEINADGFLCINVDGVDIPFMLSFDVNYWRDF